MDYISINLLKHTHSLEGGLGGGGSFPPASEQGAHAPLCTHPAAEALLPSLEPCPRPRCRGLTTAAPLDVVLGLPSPLAAHTGSQHLQPRAWPSGPLHRALKEQQRWRG